MLSPVEAFIEFFGTIILFKPDLLISPKY